MEKELIFAAKLNEIVQAERAKRMEGNIQMTLGEMIDRMEAIVSAQKSRIEAGNEEADVMFDFEYAYPCGLSSWRGSYAELAINFTFVGYGMDGYTTIKDFKPKEPRASEFLAMLKEAGGKTYTGWKGGDFTMSRSTPMWVANDGNGANTGVVGIVDEGYSIRIDTAHCEY